MAEQNRRDIDEWRLGLEPGEPKPVEKPPPPAPVPMPRDLSAERLETPLYVLTAEHLGWVAVALYALLTRLAGLGMRPLTGIEASAALFAREIANRGLAVLAVNPSASGWLDPLRAGVFLAIGAGDFGARIIAALFGLVLIGAAFSMRRRLGRAGALAFATMLTLSPTVTWFSRSTSAMVPGITLVVIAIALIFAMIGAANTAMVAGLAVAIALALSATPMVFPIAAMFVAIVILLGLFELVFRRNPIIRFRVWWERHSAHLIFCVAIAIGLFAAFESGLGRRNLVLPVAYGAMQQWVPILHPAVQGGVNFYLPVLAFYEFAIAIAGALGLVAFLTFQLRSRIAAVAFFWTIFSVGFFVANPERNQDWLVMMLTPAALLGAALIDRLHRTDAWRIARYPVALIVVLTAYAQLAINFVHYAPDSSEASWAHHMLLYWTEPATTIIAQQEFIHAARAVSDRGAVFMTAPNSVEQWYLRDMKVSDNATNTDLLVAPAAAEKPANLLESSEFTLEEKWSPSLAGMSLTRALRYFFTQRAWSEVTGTEIRVDVRGPASINPPPAQIAAPAPVESPRAATAISSTPTMTPTASPSPTATPTMAAKVTPTAAPTTTAATEPTSAPTTVAAPSVSPAPSPTASEKSHDGGQSGAPETPETGP